MLSLPGIGVFVGGRAVKVVQAEGVPGEVGGDPVQNDAHPGLMELVDEVFQVIRRTKTAGSREIAGDLVAPGGVQRVLHHGEQLYMGVAHLLDVGHQIAGCVPVGEELTLSGAAPGPQMTFVDVHGPVVRRVFGSVVHPAGIPPGVLIQLIDLGGVPRTGLGVEGVWIGLGRHGSVGGVDDVFVCIIALQAGQEALPDAALQFFQRGSVFVPSVKITKDTDLPGVGRPDPEEVALLSVLLAGVRAEAAPGMAASALGKRL